MFKSNEYFDGKVKSIAFQGENSPATIGVMAAGEYIFNTSEKEKMTVISGALSVQLKDSKDKVVYGPGDAFHIEANSSFNVVVNADTSYLCEYG